MEDIVKADIFFFITTIAVVVLSILFAVVLGLAIKVLRDLSEVARMTRQEAQLFRADLAEIRQDIREGVSDVKESIATAKSYTQAAAGAFGVKEALSFLFHTLVQSRKGKGSRKTRGKSEREED